MKSSTVLSFSVVKANRLRLPTSSMFKTIAATLSVGVLMLLGVTYALAQGTPTPPPAIGSITTRSLLMIILIGGAFGGVVGGLRRESSYTITFRKQNLQIGSLGDLLVGATAAIVIFTVADSVFRIELTFQTDAARDFVKLLAWTVLSGYAGLRLLDPLSERMVRQIASSAAKYEVSKELGVSDDVQIHVTKGDAKVAEYDVLGGKGSFGKPGFDLAAAKEALSEAVESYDLALELKSQNKPALVGKAKALRRQAEVARFEKDQKLEEARWAQAIGSLDRIIDFDPNSPKAYYSRACYRVVSRGSKADAASDLGEACKLQPGLAERAKKDTDFQSVDKEQWFLDIVG